MKKLRKLFDCILKEVQELAKNLPAENRGFR